MLCGCVPQLSGKIHFHKKLGNRGPKLYRDLAEPGWRGARVPLSGQDRYKRSLPALAEDGDVLSVDVTKLNDTKHNEAIVHWSGEKSNVSENFGLF